MLPVSILALGVLVGLYVTLRGALAMDPKRLAALLRGVGLALAVGLVLLLALSGRLVLLLGLAPALIPLYQRWRVLRQRSRTARGPTPGSTSSVETPFLRMHLDHDSGGMTGEVLAGRFHGRAVGDLTLAELRALLAECAGSDSQGALVLEAYLDRTHPDWRDAPDRRGEAPPPGPAPRGGMTLEEACQILGVAENAGADEIKEAHRRLMLRNHPDQGGSTWLAAKVNQAKDTLLAHRGRRG